MFSGCIPRFQSPRQTAVTVAAVCLQSVHDSAAVAVSMFVMFSVCVIPGGDFFAFGGPRANRFAGCDGNLYPADLDPFERSPQTTTPTEAEP